MGRANVKSALPSECRDGPAFLTALCLVGQRSLAWIAPDDKPRFERARMARLLKRLEDHRSLFARNPDPGVGDGEMPLC
jgi:hypothetical protein